MRIVRFIVHNWPLKIGAALLASFMYVGMVAVQSTQVWPGQVSIQEVNLPANTVVVNPETLPLVASIRYIAPSDVPLTTDSFRATLDLSKAAVGQGVSTLVKVQLVSSDPRVQIIDYQPQQIVVVLDPLVHRTVVVGLDYGVTPSGITVGGPPTITPSTVDVFGAQSKVAQVSTAQARVTISPSGLDVDQDSALVALDSTGAQVDGVEFNPATVHVNLQIGSQLRTQTVPVSPTIVGTPTAGYIVTSIDVTPLSVSIRGNENALSAVNGLAATQPISIAGATGDVSVKVALNLPQGVQAQDVTTISVVVHLSSPSSTRTVTIGIVPDGARSDRVYTLSTLSAIVTLGGPTAALNALDPSTLVGIVSVGSLDVGVFTVQVTVSVPSGIKNVATNPSKITVTVALPPTPSPPNPSPSPT
jgi:YbbR domain-containing protein